MYLYPHRMKELVTGEADADEAKTMTEEIAKATLGATRARGSARLPHFCVCEPLEKRG